MTALLSLRSLDRAAEHRDDLWERRFVAIIPADRVAGVVMGTGWGTIHVKQVLCFARSAGYAAGHMPDRTDSAKTGRRRIEWRRFPSLRVSCVLSLRPYSAAVSLEKRECFFEQVNGSSFRFHVDTGGWLERDVVIEGIRRVRTAVVFRFRRGGGSDGSPGATGGAGGAGCGAFRICRICLAVLLVRHEGH